MLSISHILYHESPVLLNGHIISSNPNAFRSEPSKKPEVVPKSGNGSGVVPTPPSKAPEFGVAKAVNVLAAVCSLLGSS